MRSRTLSTLLSACLAVGMASSPVFAASVKCEDGTTSEAGRGACGHHGGVVKKQGSAKAREAKLDKTEKKPSRKARVTQVVCEDGTTSNEKGRGACSHHGGIARRPVEKKASDRRSFDWPFTRDNVEKRDEQDRGTGGSGRVGEEGPASARCNDGTVSHSQQHEGTCSHHDGVDYWIR